MQALNTGRAARILRAFSALSLPFALGALLVGAGRPARAIATIQITYTDADGEGFFDHTAYTKPPYSAANPTTLGEARRAAFEAAASAWGSTLLIKIPVSISASMDTLAGNATSAVLGSAGANYYLRDGALPVASTWYPAALADTLVNQDAAPGTPMIVAQFNSAVDNSTVLGSISWYYGTSSSSGSDVDFYEVVLHEFGHGLGFQSFISSTGAYYTAGGLSLPTSYDRFLAEGPDAGAVRLTTESAVQRGISIVGGALYFAGANARTANGGTNARIYAPNPYQQGSSTSHLDYATYRNTINSLMSPIISNLVHDAGPVGNGVFKDVGWTFNTAPVASDLTVAANVDTAKSITLSATDVNNQALTYSIVTGPSHGAISTGTGAARTYTPAAGYDGPDSFTYRANDGALDSNLATVSITVSYLPPVITDFTPTSGNPGSAVTINGLHFAHSAQVQFNGVTASSQNTDTQIFTNVPAGATTGPITVIAQGGQATTATNFTVIPISKPTGQVGFAGNVTGTSADLHATVNPGNQSTTGHFQWGQNLPYDGGNTPDQSLGSGSTDVDMTATLDSLAAGTTYHYRARATNRSGELITGDSYFVTMAPGGGTALQFDASTGRVVVPGFGQAAPTGEITIEFWQKVDAAVSQSAFILWPDDSTNRINAHTPWADGNVYWDFGDINSGGRLSYTPPEPITGSWQHFAFVASQQGGYMRIYRNGVLEAAKAGASTFTHTVTALQIGGSDLINFGGQMDEFRVWSIARDGSDIKHDMNRRLQGNEPGLTACYHFDDGAGVTPADSSPSGLTGTLQGGATWVASTAPIGIPLVTTNAATGVSDTGATLNGVVNANGLASTGWLEWGTDTSYGTQTTAIGAGSGTADTPVTATIGPLVPGKTYHFRAVGSNVKGITYGADQAFTTTVAVYTMDDAVKALQTAGGLFTPTLAQLLRWNVEPLNGSAGVIDVADAIRITRKAAGTDPNP